MAELLNRFELVNELQQIIRETKDYLVIISPYIKLNEQLKEELNKLKNRESFNLYIVYGKNEDDKRKSLSDDDLTFFKSFNNVEIRYHKRLHAKIYLNENKCLITSLNLHDYSLKENIEVGILTKNSFGDTLRGVANWFSKDALGKSLDEKACAFAEYIVSKGELEFEKKQKVKKTIFGFFESKTGEAKVILEKHRTGYCIRTKTTIPLNLKMPFSTDAYKSWSKFKNPNYKERFCHGCGKEHPSTMEKPFCLDCFRKYVIKSF